MPRFRIHRLKDSLRKAARWAPHTSGTAWLKPRDYSPGGSIEAPSLYAAWARLRQEGRPLGIGDALETEAGELRVCKYVGLEEARWLLAETETPASPDEVTRTA